MAYLDREAVHGKPLTECEAAVLRRAAQGMTNRQIGRELCKSENTIKTQMRFVCAKLGARDRANAVSLGYQLDILAITTETSLSAMAQAGRSWSTTSVEVA